MKLLIVIVALATIVYAQDGYPSTGLNIDEAIKNADIFKNYISCLDNTGPCTPEGEQIKNLMGEVVATCCEKCSQKQKNDFRKVYQQLAKTSPDALDRLRKLYDPNGAYEPECKKQLS
ncbi:ejaculatory bulb-specific protein 3-like [Chrysoperla carnea]|uniref:ejaculatory bulb-specific protein 3-like n=1 Tax=Chrysoperla carnea TaxID=189513 RepID=UPI001D05CCA0|nr:ejaculatory bulb-specific protein 3-like [Chrysoperla carnea]